MAQEKYDIIIIGAGPNRLALGVYLSKAGLKVKLLSWWLCALGAGYVAANTIADDLGIENGGLS